MQLCVSIIIQGQMVFLNQLLTSLKWGLWLTLYGKREE